MKNTTFNNNMAILSQERENFIIVNPLQMVISNVWFWTMNEEKLISWLKENTKNGIDTQHGMTLTFENEDESMWFKLKWG